MQKTFSTSFPQLSRRPRKDERIYNLVPMSSHQPDLIEEVTYKQETQNYRTKFHPEVYEAYKRRRQDPRLQHRTMGVPEPDTSPRREKLSRDKSKDPGYPDGDHSKRYRDHLKKLKERLKSSSRNETLPPLQHKDDNYIIKNAVDAITTPAKVVRKKVLVDTRKGHRLPLEEAKTHSGLEKKYVYKDMYGKVPGYVRRRLRLHQEKLRVLQHYYEEKEEHGELYMVPPEDRLEIINGLKRAWDLCNKEYLALSLSSDTMRHKRHKVDLERELKELEEEIKLVEAYKVFYLHKNEIKVC